VDIIMAYENMDGALINAAVAAGAKGERDRRRRQRQPDETGRDPAAVAKKGDAARGAGW
jgi:hypothetical protein